MERTHRITLSKQLSALFLCLCIILGMLPVTAFAAGGALTHDRNGTKYTYTIGYMYSGNQGGINTREIFTAPNNYAVWLCPVCGQGGGSVGTALAENQYMPCYAYDVAANGGEMWIRYAYVRHRHNNGTLSNNNIYIPINVSMYSGCYYGYDLTNPSKPNASAPQGWQKSSAKVSFSSGSDTGTSLPDWTSTPGNYGSGIHHYEYSIDGGAWTGCPTNDASVTITKSGETIVTARSVDGAGNASTDTVTAKVYVDNVAPNQPTIALSNENWTNQNVSITLSNNGDAHSGVNHVEVSTGGTYSTYSTPVTISNHGIHTVSGKVVDNVGNVSAVAQQKVYIDKISPTINSITQTLGTNLTMTLNVSASDADSGVKGYAITQTDTKPSADSFKTTMPIIETNGTYFGWALDNAGNISDSQQVVVTALDGIPPIVTAVETERTWNSTKNWAKITATDENSGVVKIGWSTSQNDKINWQNGTDSYTFQYTNNATFYAFAQDAAGNISAAKEFTIDRIDSVNPIVDAADYETDWTQKKSITITGVDKQSGIGQYALTTSTTAPSTWQNSNVFTDLTENGTYFAWVKDNVQRVSVPFAVAIDTIDRTKPNMESITHSSTDNAPIGKFAYPLFNVVDRPTLKANDEVGVKEIQYQFVADGAAPINTNWQTYDETNKPSMKQEFIGTVVGKAVDYAGNESDLIDAKFLFEQTSPTSSYLLSDDDWTNCDVTITVNAQDNFSGVRDITLPNGTLVEGNIAKYKVSVSGVYNFAIRDNCGNITQYAVNVKNIDLLAPELSHTLKPNDWTNDKVTIELVATDPLPEDGYASSGVQSITLPDGKVVESDKAKFIVTENGIYNFIVTDKAGNNNDYRVEVKNLDHVAPTLKYSIAPDIWTNKTVNINVTANDPLPSDGYDPSGIKSITLPDKTMIESDSADFEVAINGNYTFVSTDNAGNKTTVIVTVSNIDLVKPTVDFHFEHSDGVTYKDYGEKTEYYNKDITLKAMADDDASGIECYEYKINEDKWQLFTLEKPPVFTEEQATKISVRVWDIAGNVSDEKMRNFLLDKTSPTGSHTLSVEKDGNITINFAADSNIAGTQSITRPDNSVAYAVNTATYKVSKNGEYPFVVWDRCKNQTTYTVSVTQIAVPVQPQKPQPPQLEETITPSPDIPVQEDVEVEVIPEEPTEPRLTLADLLLTILSVSFAIVTLLPHRKKDEKNNEESDDEDEENQNTQKWYAIMACCFALFSAVLFFITQPLVWRFKLIDVWTIFFAILAISNAVLLWLNRKTEKQPNDERKTNDEN